MPKNLLVVDESRTIREAARLALAGEGWSVVEASTPSEALQELFSRSPDAVLCDGGLAGPQYDFCREIRGIPEAREVPLVLMGSHVDQAAADAAGADWTVPKPFSSDELVGALRLASEARAARPRAEHFSASLDDEPLTLEPIAPVFPLSPAPSAPPKEEAVEIIDLSDDECFEELELVEDLEPVPATPAPRPEAQPSEEEEDSFDLSSLSDEALESLDLVDSSSAEPTPETEERAPAPEPEVELPADLGFGFSGASPVASAEPSAAATLLAPEKDDWVETPDSYAPPSTSLETDVWGFDRLPPEQPQPEAPLPSPECSALDVSADQAVREALTRLLASQVLSPEVERVVERVVWEVVPQLAERLIREAIEKLKSAPPV